MGRLQHCRIRRTERCLSAHRARATSEPASETLGAARTDELKGLRHLCIRSSAGHEGRWGVRCRRTAAGIAATRIVQALHWLPDMLPTDGDSILNKARRILEGQNHEKAPRDILRITRSQHPTRMCHLVRGLILDPVRRLLWRSGSASTRTEPMAKNPSFDRISAPRVYETGRRLVMCRPHENLEHRLIRIAL